MNKRPRVLIGIEEFGDLGVLMSRGLRELGFQADTMMYEQPGNRRRPYGPHCPDWNRHDSYIEQPSGRIGRWRALSVAFLRAMAKYDVIIFLGASSFFSSLVGRAAFLQYLDWQVLKTFGKTVVVFSTGSDLRSYPALVEELKRDGLSSHAHYLSQVVDGVKRTDKMQNQKAHKVERIADHIFARPNSAQHVESSYHLYWVPADLSELKYVWQDATVPLVVHAPSRRSIKGTEYVLDIISRLQRQGTEFDFRLIEGLNNDAARRILQRSHIVIEQVIMPGYGLLGVEAMATGNVVLGSAVPMYNGFSESLPVITSTPDTLYDNMRTLFENRESWPELAQRGRAYVEEYHDYRRVAEGLAQVIEGGN